MIHLTKGETNTIVLTLTEKQLLTNPNYLFVFTNRSSNEVISFVKLNATDTSLYKDRFNEFSIVTNTYFNTALNGQYTYEIYEQVSTSNINPTGLNKLETGIMWLLGTTMYYTEYTTIDTYTIRQ
jgi:Na+-transporting NADH:ubiquinone oxidoreductase subunit NqrA